ncbi:short chain dehydrogenase, partial [Paraphaeosphaeria sporulosa]
FHGSSPRQWLTKSNIPPSLRGAVSSIVGGSAGVGYAVAEACIEQGAGTIVISSSNNNRVQAAPIHRRLHESAASPATWYKLDHIAYTAGDAIIPRTPEDVDLEVLKSLFLIRSFAAVLLTKLATKHMTLGRASSMTFTSGASDIRPLPDVPIPSMLTGSMWGLSRGLAINIKPVRINVVSLGAVNTDLLKGPWSVDTDSGRDNL